MPQEGICLKGGYSVKTRFTIVGYGWRAQFYLRAARMIPQEFEVTSIVTRSGERAAQIRKETGIPAVRSLEEALGDQPDFVLLCVPRAVMKDWIVRLMEQKIPVLCETPPGKDVDELNELWKEKVRLGGNVQVTEQYFLQPYYAAMIRLARSGLLGDISNMNMSAIHGYHAVSIFRKVLGVGFENCEILGRRFRFPVTETATGEGGITEGGCFALTETGWTWCLKAEGRRFLISLRSSIFLPSAAGPGTCRAAGEKSAIWMCTGSMRRIR